MTHLFCDFAFRVLSEYKVSEMMANGIEAFVIRGGYVTSVDATVAPQVAIFRKLGAPYGIYRYWVTGYDANKQGDALLKDGLNNPACVVGDAEEKHEYYSWAVNDPDIISRQYQLMTNRVKSRTVRPYIGYGGPWFTHGYAPGMTTWLKESWYWGAAYPRGWDKSTPDLWPETYQELIAKAKALPFPKDPLFPTWAAWQFAGDIVVAELGIRMDYNRVDREDVWQWMFHGGPMPALPCVEPEPLPTNLVQYIAANPIGKGTMIQAGPGWEYKPALYVANGTPLSVDPAYTEKPAWCKVVSPVIGYAAKNRIAEVTQ